MRSPDREEAPRGDVVVSAGGGFAGNAGGGAEGEDRWAGGVAGVGARGLEWREVLLASFE